MHDKSIDQKAMQEQKFIQMTQAPVKPLICKLAVPTIVSMMITSIYNMADTFFVGQLDGGGDGATSAAGAVGVVFPLMAVIQAVGFFFGQGYPASWGPSTRKRPSVWPPPVFSPPWVRDSLY